MKNRGKMGTIACPPLMNSKERQQQILAGKPTTELHYSSPHLHHLDG